MVGRRDRHRAAAENRAIFQGRPSDCAGEPRSCRPTAIRRSAHPAAQGYFAKRDYAAAVSDLEAAVAIDPENAVALNRLAWIEATCPQPAIRNGARAVENARKACKLTDSHNPEYLSTLAAALAEQGEYSRAADFERDALRLVTRSPETGLTADVQRMRQQLQLEEQGRAYRDHSAGLNLPIFGFGAMLFLGFVSGAWTAGRRGARVGYPPELIWDVGIWLFIAGVIGCRIFYCIQYGSKLFYNDIGGHHVLKSFPELLLAAVNLPDGGLVYYGAIPAGLLAQSGFATSASSMCCCWATSSFRRFFWGWRSAASAVS